MKLGIGSWTYAWSIGVPGCPPAHPMSPFDLLERAVALNVRVVQFADNLPLAALVPSVLDEMVQRAAQHGITIEVGTRGIRTENLRTYLELAQRVGSPILRVVIDTANHRPSPDEVVALLRPIMPAFEGAGVSLAIENHDRFKARTLASIIEQVESPSIGVCLDTVNSFGALEGPDVVVPALAPWVVNLHVKDFAVVRAGHNMGFTVEGRPAGQGMLDVPWLLRCLREHGRDVNAILEQWTPPEYDLAVTIAKEARWAEESIRYLRTLIPD